MNNWDPLYKAFVAANNTSLSNLNNWARGRSPGSENTIKGTIGEGLFYQSLKDKFSYNPISVEKFGRDFYGDALTRISQVDVVQTILTGSIRAFGMTFHADFSLHTNNFDGTISSKFLGSEKGKRDLWVINYEVKTFDPARSAASLYEGIKDGINKAILTGAGKNDKVIGVLAIDQDAWNKVANDKDFGEALKQHYNRLVESGNALQLVEGLHSTAEAEQKNIRKVLRKVKESDE